MARSLPEKFYSLLEEIQALDFTIVELNLYLDTHPDDEEAYAQLCTTSEKAREIKEEFEGKFGPLQLFGGTKLNQEKWTWSKGPWPWQV